MKLMSLDEFVVQEGKLLALFKEHWEKTHRANCQLPMWMAGDEWSVAYYDFIAEHYDGELPEGRQ